jgi:ATP-dependent Zn protease
MCLQEACVYIQHVVVFLGKVSIRKKDLYQHSGKEQWFSLQPVDPNSEVQVGAGIENTNQYNKFKASWLPWNSFLHMFVYFFVWVQRFVSMSSANTQVKQSQESKQARNPFSDET